MEPRVQEWIVRERCRDLVRECERDRYARKEAHGRGTPVKWTAIVLPVLRGWIVALQVLLGTH